MLVRYFCADASYYSKILAQPKGVVFRKRPRPVEANPILPATLHYSPLSTERFDTTFMFAVNLGKNS